jgi:hypothetical protein
VVASRAAYRSISVINSRWRCYSDTGRDLIKGSAGPDRDSPIETAAIPNSK